MKMVDQAHYHLSDIHDLRPFWDAAVKSVSSREPSFKVSCLLMELCNKHERLIPELSILYLLEIKEREKSMKENRDRNISIKEKEIRDNLMKLL